MARPQKSLIRWLIFAPVAVLALFSSATYATNQIVTEPTDYWFEFDEPTVFIAETYMVEGSPSDPQLWFYDAEGVLLTSNDDYNGLQSYILLQVSAGKYRLRAGTCCWEPDVWRTGEGWNTQYELSFNGLGSTQTTSTTTVDTTSSTTSTITTTSTTSTSTTSTSTTSTTVPVSTTMEPATTTTTTSPVVPETTTTHQSQIPTTLAEQAVPATTTTTLSQPMPIPTFLASTSVPLVTTTTTVALPEMSPTSLPLLEQPLQTPSTITDTKIIELLDDIKTASPAQISMAVEAIIDTGITADQATQLATTPEVLNSVDSGQARVIFESLNLDTLETAELETLIAVVQDAPDNIRESFETVINIFDGKTDTYVPLGSSVPISTRRLVVAAGAMMSMVPVPSRKQ